MDMSSTRKTSKYLTKEKYRNLGNVWKPNTEHASISRHIAIDSIY